MTPRCLFAGHKRHQNQLKISILSLKHCATSAAKCFQSAFQSVSKRGTDFKCYSPEQRPPASVGNVSEITVAGADGCKHSGRWRAAEARNS